MASGEERRVGMAESFLLHNGSYWLDLRNKTAVMGVLNVTPDSFSDGGLYEDTDTALGYVKQMVADGADIIDIGGESTRPGHNQISSEEEAARVLPVIRACAEQIEVPLSIDTYKAKTAELALRAGADIINDIWGAKKDPDMARVAAAYDVPLILMHNRDQPPQTDVMTAMVADLQESLAIAHEAGVGDENIILDPGIGFGKTYRQNLEVMDRLNEITCLGYPVLLGTSRKSMIAKTLNLPADERVEGTGATICLGIEKGCQIVRVHDVLPMKRMVMMMDAMVKNGGLPV